MRCAFRPLRFGLLVVIGGLMTLAVSWTAALLVPSYRFGPMWPTASRKWPTTVPSSFPLPLSSKSARATAITHRYWEWHEGRGRGMKGRFVKTWAFGWPFRALRCEFISSDYPGEGDVGRGFLDVPPELDALLSLADGPGRMPTGRVLPYFPCWPRLLGDVAFFSAVTWLLAITPLRAIGRVRRRLAHRPGLCPRCDYPIGVSPVCTECGHPLAAVA